MGYVIAKRWALLALAAAVLLTTSPMVQAEVTGYGPGRVELQILAGRDHVLAGTGGIWNSRDKMHIQLDPTEGWRIKGYNVDMGGGEEYSPPLTPSGNPKIGHFDYREKFPSPYVNPEAGEDKPYRRTLVLDLDEDLGFQWGAPWADQRTQGVAIFLELVQFDEYGEFVRESGAWVVPELIIWEEEIEEDGDVDGEEIVADESSGRINISDRKVKVDQGRNGARGKVNRHAHQRAQRPWEVDESEAVMEFEGGRWGWWFRFIMGHPRTGHFIDSPVAGLHVETPTYEGVTGVDAAFDYFPGERVDISIGDIFLGSAVADHKISPLDVFEMSDTADGRVINMARLLQSLDIDGEPQGGIVITAETAQALAQAMESVELETIDFGDDIMVDFIIDQTILYAGQMDPPVLLTEVSAEDAVNHLESQVNNVMFRKNVSKTPELASSKAKMNISTVWLPALRANGEPAAFTDETGVETQGIPYYDEDGNLLRVAAEAKPVIITYTDAHEETGEHDVWAAVSRDDGNTWKRKNISRSADRSSFTLANGEDYYGGCKKPVFQVKGNKILVAWSSKFARGGKPRYSEDEFLPQTDADGNIIYDENGDPVPSDTPNPNYTPDIWGVAGPQRSHDYTEEGFPEVGEVPYAALWICRGLILTEADLAKPMGGPGTATWGDTGYVEGDIVWYKPERLTSGRRDVNQIFVGGASKAGFGIVWQEDPNGVKPGKAVGPGPGWGGATTSHKTDIWYTYLTWGDHSLVDVDFELGGDPEHEVEDVLSRPKAKAAMPLPVRLSDNDVVNTDNILVELDADGYPTTGNPDNPLGYTPLLNEDAQSDDADGTHAYAYMIPGLIDVNNASGAPADVNVNGFYEFVNNQDEIKHVAITEDGRLLDGDTGASRANIFLQPYEFTKPDGSIGTSAWAIITYEETKGAGSGPPETDGEGDEPQDGSGNSDAYVPEEGKNVIYHSFDFKSPDLVSAGTVLNMPEIEKTIETISLPGLDGQTIDFEVARPELDASGNVIPKYLVEEDGETWILDYLGRPQLAYENARRGRFILQGIGAVRGSRTIMIMVYKEGEEGHGRPSDIMMRRWEIPADEIEFTYRPDGSISGVASVEGNPYRAENIVGEYVQDPLSQQWYWSGGPVNMSSVTPRVVTESQGDSEQEDAYGAVKVVEWDQTVENLEDLSSTNPFDDARAHRGQIRGNFVTLGFSYTPNWAAARNGNDKYDFFVRRSFNGGKTWTTDPNGVVDPEIVDGDGNGGYTVAHSITWTHPSGTQSAGTKIEEWFYFTAGQFERMRNLSQLANNKESVIEPRLVAVPGTIKVDGNWTGIPEDKQDPTVYYVAYGTSTNPKKDPETGEQEEPAPKDLFYSFTQDRGETYFLDAWVVNPDSDGGNAGETVIRWPWMAKGDPEQGEVQLRMTPNGERFYATWLDEGEEGSDIVFRRICPPTFGGNVLPDGETGTSADESQSDSGGE